MSEHRFKVGDKVVIDGTKTFGVRAGKICTISRLNTLRHSDGAPSRPIYYIHDETGLDFMEYESNLMPYTEEYGLLYE